MNADELALMEAEAANLDSQVNPTLTIPVGTQRTLLQLGTPRVTSPA